MNLLAIDSACSILSIAVSKSSQNDEEIFYEEIQAGTRHSELIMNVIDNQMKTAKLQANDLNGVICFSGPGSFTGLRIGYSIAKALALSLSIPFIPVPTLDCMIFPFREQNFALAVIESKKNSWFFSFYKNGKTVVPVTEGDKSLITLQIMAQIKETEKIILTGSGAVSLYEALDANIKKNIKLAFTNHGYAKELIFITKFKNLFDNYNDNILFSGPEYFKETDAQIALNNVI
jgi:tRNA threonylcarbamoyladenosine biosynthesis protein TsaB